MLSLQSSTSSITSFLCCPQSFCLTAGSDRVIRFWDLHEPIDSYRVSQPDLPDDVVARYTGRIENSTCVMEEVLHTTHGAAAMAAQAEDDHKGGAAAQGKNGASTELEERMRSALAKKSRGQSPPSSCHQSEIVDLKAIEFPQKMLASASTDGIIKIWI